MYRAEVLGLRLASRMSTKTDPTYNSSRLSDDSGYVDEVQTKSHRNQMALDNEKQNPSIPQNDDDKTSGNWKITGTLEELSKMDTKNLDILGEDEAISSPTEKINNIETVTQSEMENKQKEEALKRDREAFSSIANQNQQESAKIEEKVDPKIDPTQLKEILSQAQPKILHDLESQTLKVNEGNLNPTKESLMAGSSLDGVTEGGLLGLERISLIPPTPRKEDAIVKRSIKDLNHKFNTSNASSTTSTDSSSLDAEAEQLKLSELGNATVSLYTGSIIQTATLNKMHAEIGRLNSDQRELCRSCFQKIEKHPIPFGLQIMIRLFSNHPQYKDIWPQFKQIPDSSLMHAPELKRHARVYMAGLRLIINSMNDDSKLETSLRGIAQAHLKWHIHKYHLINMLPCVIEAFKTKFEMRVDQVQAWTTLFDVIANLIDIFRNH